MEGRRLDVGHKLGIAGSSMMVLMLLYSVRKRVGALRRAGPLRRWLDGHIFLGVFGPLLVVLHSTFKVQGLVALSFWSMVVVATSGVLGRFLYLQIPRTRAGEELALAELEAQDRELSSACARASASTRRGWPSSTRSSRCRRAPGSSAASWQILVGDLRLRSRLGAFARRCGSVPRPCPPSSSAWCAQKAQVRRRIVLWDRVHELFHYWHVLHKPFAVVMYLFMIVHVVVAVVTGYGWAADREAPRARLRSASRRARRSAPRPRRPRSRPAR